MDTRLDTLYKASLKPTRSLDEGFESDPERISTSDSNSTDENNNHASSNSANQPPTPPIRFNVLQRTDRDGVQHTQIAHRRSDHWTSGPPGIIFVHSPGSTAVTHNNNKNINNNHDCVDSKLMTITRSTANHHHQHHLPTTASQMMPSVATANQQDAYRRRLSPKSAYSHTTGVLRSQSVDAVRPILLPKIKLNPNQQQPQSGAHNTMTINNKYGVRSTGNGSVTNSNLSQLSSAVPARISNTNSMYTFYPAEGNISLYPSHYGLTYKSSHLNVQTPAPVSWTQSVPRHQRR